jgi:hypothetical protein
MEEDLMTHYDSKIIAGYICRVQHTELRQMFSTMARTLEGEGTNERAAKCRYLRKM